MTAPRPPLPSAPAPAVPGAGGEDASANSRSDRVRLTWRIGTLAASVAALLLALLWLWTVREPSLFGQPMSYWTLPWRAGARETPARMAQAEAAMEASHVRWLIRQLQWRPSQLRSTLAGLLNSIGLSVSSRTPGDYREPSARLLGRLGERAAPAIPYLEELARDDTGSGNGAARAAAQASLLQLGRGSISDWVNAASEPTRGNWWLAAEVVTRLGTNAPESAAIFERLMLGTNPPGVRIVATRLYAHAAPHSAAAIANLAAAVRDPVTRPTALLYLGYRAAEAEAAAPAVAEAMADPNPTVRQAATNLWNRLPLPKTGAVPGRTPELAPGSGSR